MTLITDVLLVVGALGAALYCHVLARRLRRFTDLEKGVGGAVAVMALQVDDLRKTLAAAKEGAQLSAARLENLNASAEEARGRLEILLAAMHDRPAATEASAHSVAFVPRPRVAERV
jgi:hypothetical protein